MIYKTKTNEEDGGYNETQEQEIITARRLNGATSMCILAMTDESLCLPVDCGS